MGREQLGTRQGVQSVNTVLRGHRHSQPEAAAVETPSLEANNKHHVKMTGKGGKRGQVSQRISASPPVLPADWEAQRRQGRVLILSW